MNKTKTNVATELFVDVFIEKHGHPPTYNQVAEYFNLSGPSAAASRCKGFRHKMNRHGIKNDIDKIERAQKLLISCTDKVPNKIVLINILNNSAAALIEREKDEKIAS